MLKDGDRIIVDGVPVEIGSAIASSFCEGDRLFGVDSGRLLHVPRDVNERVRAVVDRSIGAFAQLQELGQDRVTQFYLEFARSLRTLAVSRQLITANHGDVVRAKAKGRSTTRLELTPTMLSDMASALDLWASAKDRPNVATEMLDHGGWRIEVVRAPLGVVAFVFEGRPKVFTDATGVLRRGNTCVFRIGSDARDTAAAIMESALRPSLAAAGLPLDAVLLLEEASHASAWSLFSQRGVSLAVARGSGDAVRDLGAVARQSGVTVSLHGTGGAWMVISPDVDTDLIHNVVAHSLDRKVCNTTNVVVVVGHEPDARLEAVVRGAETAARSRNSTAVIHDVTGLCVSSDPRTQVKPGSLEVLATEWEWENDPEISVVHAVTLEEAVVLFNTYSPRFILSLLTTNEQEHSFVWAHARAPFIGNGMTRWVDGQYALHRPELGLANWELGAQIGRGAILSGGDVFSVRYRAEQSDSHLHR